MNGFLITMLGHYPWFGPVLIVLAVAGVCYLGVWVHGLAGMGSDWVAYRRLVLQGKTAIRRDLVDNPRRFCPQCRERDAMVLEAMLVAGDGPPEHQHPDGPDDPGWDEPGEDWSPRLAWGKDDLTPARQMADLAEVLNRAKDLGLLADEAPQGGYECPVCHDTFYDLAGHQARDHAPAGEPAPEERCNNRDCDLYGFIHRPPCRLSPTMPAACYPAMGLKDGPAMPPQPWSGLAASLEVLARGDDSPTLTGWVAAELGHDTTEAAVDSMWTRAMSREVIAMISDGIVPITDEIVQESDGIDGKS